MLDEADRMLDDGFEPGRRPQVPFTALSDAVWCVRSYPSDYRLLSHCGAGQTNSNV